MSETKNYRTNLKQGLKSVHIFAKQFLSLPTTEVENWSHEFWEKNYVL